MPTPTAITSGPLRLLYGLYAWLVLLLVVILVSVCLVLPGLRRRRAIARWGAATIFRLTGSRIEVRGRVPTGEDVAVVVANHQSYLDGMILTAVLPPHYTFLIKREMVRVPIASFLLRRLGSQFVDRTSSSHRHRSARKLVQAARDGSALAVFPEGTFDAEPGLKPFHLGAFRAAWQAGLPIAPVVITGARQKLPAERWLPSPGPLAVEFCPIIASSGYADQHALVRVTRDAILQRLGEPDLDPSTAEPPEIATVADV
jgi:1-acyl-sn-glycerol-3-phosphate acyltransferase